MATILGRLFGKSQGTGNYVRGNDDTFISLREASRLISMVGKDEGQMPDNDKGYIDSGYTKNADLYAVINKICKAATLLVWNVYEIKDERAAKVHKSLTSQARFDLSAFKAAYNIIDGVALSQLIEQPNKYQGWSEFLEAAIGYKLITGNNIIYGLTPEGYPAGYFKEMYNLAPQFVDIILRGNPSEYTISYKLDHGDWRIDFTQNECIHRKNFNPKIETDEWAWGMSPIRAAREIVARSNQGQRAANRAFTNMGAYGMISNDSEDIGFSSDKAEQLERDYRRVYSGSDNTKKVIVTTAKARWTNFGMSPVDLAIIESMKMDLRQFCNIYGVPMVLLNDSDSSTYNNISTAVKMLYTDAVLPEVNDLRDHLNRTVAKAYGEMDGRKYYIDYDLTSIAAFRDEIAALSERLVREVQNGITTPNEARQDLGRSIATQPEADQLMRSNRQTR